MTSRKLWLGTMLGGFAILALPALAQDKKPEARKPDAKPAAKPVDPAKDAKKPDGAAAGQQEGQPAVDPATEAWMKLAAPGEHHKHLAAIVGKWNVVSKFQMAPGAPPQESKGSAEYKPILGGRFIAEEYQGDMMGTPFEGLNIMGYDNQTQKYTSIWMDSMGTMMIYSEGTCDGSGKVITYTGEYLDPMTGGKEKKKFKSIMKIDGKDKAAFEMWDTGPDGKEFRSLEINMTRAS